MKGDVESAQVKSVAKAPKIKGSVESAQVNIEA
jgi:hypothetical protein